MLVIKKLYPGSDHSHASVIRFLAGGDWRLLIQLGLAAVLIFALNVVAPAGHARLITNGNECPQPQGGVDVMSNDTRATELNRHCHPGAGPGPSPLPQVNCMTNYGIAGSSALIDCSPSTPPETGASIIAYAFSIADKPAASTLGDGALYPNDPAYAERSFVADASGVYTIQVIATTSDNFSNSALVNVNVFPVPLRLETPVLTVAAGGSVDVTVAVDADQPLNALQFILEFDSAIFTINGWSDASGGRYTHQPRNLAPVPSAWLDTARVNFLSGETIAEVKAAASGTLQIVRVTFQVRTSAAAGFYPIAVGDTLNIPVFDTDPQQFVPFASPLFSDFNNIPLNFGVVNYRLDPRLYAFPKVWIYVSG